MTSQKIKDGLTTSYMLFVFDFGDPAAVDREAVEKQIGLPIAKIFDTKPGYHRTIQRLGRTKFNKVMALYFSDLRTKEGIDADKLGERMAKGQEMLKRHLGKEVMIYLSLLLSVSRAISEKRQGLLFEEAN